MPFQRQLVHCAIHPATILLLTMILSLDAAVASPLSTSIRFSRQKMRLNGNPLNGTFDFRFKLFDAVTGGNQIGQTVNITNVTVSNGSLPTQLLNFGDGAFNGEARFIETRARQGASGFLLVGGRTRVLAVPYALAVPGLYTLQNDESPNLIGGFAGNIVADGVVGATISGGGTANFDRINSAIGDFATISGGLQNTANAECAIGGGIANDANGTRNTIAGGGANSTENFASTVGGGQNNHATANNSTVCGGQGNTASGQNSIVGGGNFNVASGMFSIAPGGVSNSASGDFSFAAGRRAKADAAGSFVWADNNNQDLFSGGSNTFNVRASGGTVFYSNAAATVGVLLAPGSGAWAAFSDRIAKTNIEPVDPREALRKVIKIPISTWNYISQKESIRHIGPMAQDFHAAFGLGESERHISTIDADGVALAAIQGLHQLVVEKDAVIESQQRQIAELAARLAHIEAILTPSNQP